MAQIEDLIVRTDVGLLTAAKKRIEKMMNTEYHLRRKIKRYRKHIKELERGVKWRNEVLIEMAFRLGLTEEDAKSIVERGFGRCD